MFDIKQIMSIIPHRYPMLLVDRIIELEENRRIVGIKNVTVNEPFFQGHFPGNPIMPGVLIIEAMAQTGGVLLLHSVQEREKKLIYFMSINNAKFRKPVIPGDTLRLEVEVLNLRSWTCKLKAVAKVDESIVAEAEITSAMVDR
ncbi:MAG: 3-hydroxyacyl-ACP dehydratase FabZ [Acidobacteriota bacterium]